MYARFGCLAQALKVFDRMSERDVVSWNSLISGCSTNRHWEEALEVYNMARMAGIMPDSFTVSSVFPACGGLVHVKEGEVVHCLVEKIGLHIDVAIDLKVDSITCVMLLSISTQLANKDLGKEIHCDIIKLGFDSDLIVNNAMVDMYVKCGQMNDSLKIFDNMKTHDRVAWNTIITACVQSGDFTLGLRMTNQMRTEGVMPDMATVLGILPMCSFLAAKRKGKEIHGCIFRFGFEADVPTGNALIEMYFKCGCLKNSVQVFDCMKVRDVVTWTAMISADWMYGEGKKAFHSGLVEEGLACFDQMKKDYNLEPRIEHYACVVDLLSRSGLISKAEKFICSMPLKPDASIWGCLLSAC
ncbi:hypothetical protein CRYUN_Cryun27aG0015100 [Craigia yunnanensis]